MTTTYESALDRRRPGVRTQRWTARAIIAAALVLGACATGDANTEGEAGAGFSEDPRLGERADTVCFAGRLSGFYAEGERALVLRRTRDDVYLVQTGYCPSLRRVEAVALPQSSRCVSRGDELFVSDTRFVEREDMSDRAQRCRILSIHHWTPEAGESVETEADGNSR